MAIHCCADLPSSSLTRRIVSLLTFSTHNSARWSEAVSNDQLIPARLSIRRQPGVAIPVLTSPDHWSSGRQLSPHVRQE